eukprot:6542034-Alexandrium_andersonii.AAC.1
MCIRDRPATPPSGGTSDAVGAGERVDDRKAGQMPRIAPLLNPRVPAVWTRRARRARPRPCSRECRGRC